MEDYTGGSSDGWCMTVLVLLRASYDACAEEGTLCHHARTVLVNKCLHDMCYNGNGLIMSSACRNTF